MMGCKEQKAFCEAFFFIEILIKITNLMSGGHNKYLPNQTTENFGWLLAYSADPLCASPLGFVGVTSARITKPPKTTIETPNELTKKASVE